MNKIIKFQYKQDDTYYNSEENVSYKRDISEEFNHYNKREEVDVITEQFVTFMRVLGYKEERVAEYFRRILNIRG